MAARPTFVKLHSLIQCPITNETLTLEDHARILVLPCGHVCSNSPWFDDNRRCPECRAAFEQEPSDLPKCAMIESIVAEMDKGTLVLADPVADHAKATIVECKRVLSGVTIADGAGLFEMVENLVCEKQTADSNVDKLTQTLARFRVLITRQCTNAEALRAQVTNAERRCAQAHARERATRRERDRARDRLEENARGMQETISTTMQDFIDTSF